MELRAALAAYLGRVRGVVAEAGGLLVVSGFAQGLALLGRVLPARYGRAIAVEDPGSPGAAGLLDRAGLDPVPIAVDGEGVRVDQLAASGARVVLVTPAHQFPSGVVLWPRRRAELLEWAAGRGGLIVEDDYDAEFRYDREPVGALQGWRPTWWSTPARSARRDQRGHARARGAPRHGDLSPDVTPAPDRWEGPW